MTQAACQNVQLADLTSAKTTEVIFEHLKSPHPKNPFFIPFLYLAFFHLYWKHPFLKKF